jgi:predicted DNA-binding transcriptional regulator AlpA
MSSVLDTPAAAAYVGLAPATLCKLRCSGTGPKFMKLSKAAVRYRIEDLEAWLADRTVISTSAQAG